MAKSKEQKVKSKGGRKPRYDYTSDVFLDRIEKYAKKGLTDKEIAFELTLNQTYFYDLKAKIPELSDTLSRGRARVNTIVRQRYLAVALGGIKVKRVTIQKNRLSDDPNEKIILEEVKELAPSLQGLSNWLFNHDEEWRQRVIDGKRLNVTSGGEKVNNEPLIFLSADELTEEQRQAYIKKAIEGDTIDTRL